MKKIIQLVFFIVALCAIQNTYGQCPPSFTPVCTAGGYTFTVTNGGSGPAGNAYGCLSSQPSPSFFYLIGDNAGTINMNLNAPFDIDYIVWGPFPDVATGVGACGSYTAGQIVDCSFSATNNEQIDITGVSNGDVYILMVTNYAGVNQTATLSQNGGGGSSVCPPEAECQNITVQLDATGNVGIVVADVDNGSSASGGIASITIDDNAFTCADVGANNVVLTITDNYGSTDQCTAVVTVEDNIAPTVSCQNITIQLDASGNASIVPTDIETASADNCGVPTLSLDNTTFTCADVGANSVVLTATDASGNTATCNSTVTVEDNINPVAVCQNITVQLDASGNATITATDVDGGSSDACGIASLAVDISAFTCADVGANSVVLTVTDNNGNTAICNSTVTVEDNIAPTATCQNITVQLDASGNATINAIDLDNGSTDNCGGTLTYSVNTSAFTCADVGANAVVFTVADPAGNTSNCNATVTIADNVAPTAACQSIIVQLDATGNATITTAMIDNGSADNCGVPTLSLNNTAFNCTNVGPNTVTLTATDANGNTATCDATVTIQDNVPPTAICQNVTVQLDAVGFATVSPLDINNGSSDNCGIANLSLDVSSFTCGDVGANPVVLTVTDVNGNTSTCNATVTVQDNISPTAVCSNVNVYLDAAGNASISPADVDGGSSDNCAGALNFAVDVSNFTCADIGANTVVLTVTDAAGNSNTCNAIVNVLDDTPPTAVCNANLTVQLDANGEYTLTTAEIENGSTDNCGTASLTYSIDEEYFDCDNIGQNTVVLFVEDAAGNIATCNSIVTVEDNVVPTAICQNITVQLDAAGNATITAADVDGGSSDNCSGVSLSIDVNSFTCADIGANTVTLTVTDAGANTSTCTATVTIEDNVAPTPLCQNITIQLDGTGNASITTADIDAGSTDNCGLASLALSNTAFTCADIGVNTVTLTATDNNGNFNTCNAIVTVEDAGNPTAVCQNITVQLDATGNATITPSDVDGGSTDNCGGAVSLSIDVTNFDCTNVGANNVTLTVTDGGGNTDNCVAIVTVEDNVNPVAFCQNITVQLDGIGNVTITPAMVDNGSTDNCGTPTLSLDNTNFDCTDVGSNTVVLTATDAAGNTNTCNATVTVEDNTAPTATCQNITVQLDATGNTTIVTGDIDNGSADNCGTVNLSLSDTEFDCDDVGANTVTLFANDGNGNASQCNATVTVEDNVNPTATCQNITVQLDANGNATITPADVDNGSTDNCGVANLALDVTTFTCANVGANAVVLTVTDVNGNTNTCNATVTVEDNVDPVAICQDITVQLDAAGNALITPAMIDNGSFDNCNTLTLSLDITTFDCTDVGANTVILTADDGNGNTTTCNATVTVDGVNTTPTVVCNPTNVALDINGNASIVDADIFDAASNAVCGEANRYLSQYNFTCADVGTVSVTASIEDNNGNIGSCMTTVTVSDPFVTTMVPYDSVCINSPITLEAIQGRPGSTIHWYSDATGNNTLNIGNPYTTQAITANTTVWVAEQYGSGCMSPLVQVDIFVKDGDAPIISSNSPVCTREEIQLTGESGFISYQWTGPNGYSSSNQNPTISNADATNDGTYSLVVISLDGCVSEAATTNVIVQPDVVLGAPLEADYTFCEDGEILVQPSLSANQSGNWTGPNGFTSTTDVLIDPANENLHEGMYTLVLTDNNTGCTSISYTTTILLTPRPVIADIVGGNAVICPGEPFVLETEQLQGVTYFWEGPNGFASSDNPIEIAQADISNTGMYTVYASDGMCISDTVITEVGMYPQPVVTISSDATIFEQSEVITLTANGGVAYQWVPVTGIDDATSGVIDITGLDAGIYTYEVFGIDLNTCMDSADITFEVTPREILEVNNVITPNGDGSNDTWVIGFLENIDSYTITIIDRGGMQLYEISDNYNNDWNGTYEGNDLPEGAYFYIIKTPQKLYRGGLTIVR